MGPYESNRDEWLETDGLGGYATGTVSGLRTRRYHGLLAAAADPPTRRAMLVNGVEAWIESGGKAVALTSHLYGPGLVHPDGASRIIRFDAEPWPTWTFLTDGGLEIEFSLFMPRGFPACVLTWRARGAPADLRLRARPLLSGRDHHAIHRENPAFRFDADVDEGRVRWRPYDGVPGVTALSNGRYEPGAEWYRNFLYEQERERGLEQIEDLASPGTFHWDLRAGDAILVFAADTPSAEPWPEGDAATIARGFRSDEMERRRHFPSRLHRAADAYIVKRRDGRSIVAGYPWFTDWARDVFISLRGLCVAGGRLEEARQILLEWSDHVSEGLLPNFFPDGAHAPEYNSVDAPLWFIIAVHDFLNTMKSRRMDVLKEDRRRFQNAIENILFGYEKGTRFGIRMEPDGLIAAGIPGQQLTWMDAKVGDRVMTPRIGKPVEVQALWLNAVRIAAEFSPHWKGHFEASRDAFRHRFWNEAGQCLFDVVDVYHQPLTADAAFRPNQIFAVGGLPYSLLEKDQARKVVDAVEKRLLTPIGLRSLASDEPGYAPHYAGGPVERDAAYHQGTVWPWLMGPFVEAWCRVRGGTVDVRKEARARFLAPLLRHLDRGGLGHLCEIADGDAPHARRGCPFQAWSVGEALRLSYSVLL